MRVSPYWKAVVGALVAGLGSLAVALQDQTLTGPEVITAVVVCAAAAGSVWRVPNTPAGKHAASE